MTGACLAVRRTVWDSVGGMSEWFPLNYNDLDLCLRLQQQGYRTIQANQIVVRHLETSSRSAGSESWEDDELQGCLEPGENKLMLEFIGMEKEVAMMWRHR